MKFEYQNLIKDTIKFVEAKKTYFYEEAFLIKKNTKPDFLLSKNNFQITKTIKPKTSLPKKNEEDSIKIVEKKVINTVLEKPKKTFLDKAQQVQSNLDQFQDIYKLITKLDPNFKLIEESLDDNIAKKIIYKWKYKLNAYPITILTSNRDDEELKFLQSIAKALEIYFFESKVVLIDSIEKENQWDEFLKSENIRLFIAVDDQIWHLKNLMQYYKEIPNQSLKKLGKIPLFLIPDLKLYFRNFILKKSLWKALCKTISNL
jgi:hypothetical protein